MNPFAAYSREQLRRAYTEAWSKRRAGAPLAPLQSMIADVVEMHPEYQGLVQDAHAALTAGGDAAGARENPFLHMGLHLAVGEQLSIDRPPGVRALHRQLLAACGDPHAALHALMQALGETLWEAERRGAAPDERHYLELARRNLGRAPSRRG
ncbi:MAG TPA: DUF1841 family protein [Steroidobacteraceae bacterium]|nr:DUF1841 family protein [Steroidobacteraceae bacterium]